MSYLNCRFTSEVLGFQTQMTVILPEQCFVKAGKQKRPGNYPVLYLLHGLSDDHTMWHARTSIERYAMFNNLAVVMPTAHRSFYADMANGYKYWTFISEELPEIVKSMFPISDRREDTYVAGNSMGGYGAFKLALSRPERFCAAASLSGALDITTVKKRIPAYEIDMAFSDPDNLKGTKNDLFRLAKDVRDSDGPKPRLFQCCGLQDYLYEDNAKFRDYCREIGLGLTYEEEDGNHEWGYWDKKISRILEWFLKG